MNSNSMNYISDEITLQIQQIQLQIISLKCQEKEGTITSAGAAFLDELTKKEFKLKEQKVLEVHTNAIQSGTLIKNGKEKTYYQTRVKSLKNPPRCSTYEALIEKLYDHYFGTTILNDYSFESVFEAALEEKIRLTSPKEKTVRDYRSSYKAFITPEFGSRDIREITSTQLKEYLQVQTRRINPTWKRFLKFKGILNLAFRYASDPDHRIIAVNIVPSDNGPYKKNLTMSDDRPEEKAFQPHEIEMIREYLWSRVEKEKYDVNGYAILFSSHTGVRQGEIPSLKWEDISEKLIHIHSQQNDRETANGKEYYYNPTTKNEKGESKNGRYIPLTQEVKHILNELKKKQEALGIHSEWVFAKEDGNWTTTVAYYESLYKICIDKLGLGLSNNHTFRIALNSYVLIPMGLDAPERARILGHSVQTNLEHYTFSRDKEFLSEIGDLPAFARPWSLGSRLLPH